MLQTPSPTLKTSLLIRVVFLLLIGISVFFAMNDRTRISAVMAVVAGVFEVAHRLPRKKIDPPTLDSLSILLVALALMAPLAMSLGILELIVDAWTILSDPFQPLRQWLERLF